MTEITQHPSIDAPGIATRRIAADMLHAILNRRQSLDQTFDFLSGFAELRTLEDRDRALVHMLVAKTLRRLGTLRALLTQLLQRGFPREAPRVEILLLLGATQILFLSIPNHAAVDLAVQLTSEDQTARRYTGLVNAVLRRIAREGHERIRAIDPSADTPEWLMKRWIKNFGSPMAQQFSAAHANEPPLDLTVKNDAAQWAAKLGGTILPTGSIRLVSSGSITALPGFAEGAWWVQDAAAAIPATLLGNIAGLSVVDLCAAPGGKTAQLLTRGANVTAVDRSAPRLERLKSNLQRLKLDCKVVTADASQWNGGLCDAVLLDAPCTATGTIRRNPDVPWLRQPEDLNRLVALQSRLIDHAAELVRPGGVLMYVTCSLEPEECERQIENLLIVRPNLKRLPITSSEVGNIDSFISASGDLRTLPCHLPNEEPRLSGCDGFYAARLQRLT